MAEVKVKKVKYVIQYRVNGDEWAKSDWNNNAESKSDLDYMIERTKEARRTNPFKTKEYQLVKQTHSITTEVVDE